MQHIEISSSPLSRLVLLSFGACSLCCGAESFFFDGGHFMSVELYVVYFLILKTL